MYRLTPINFNTDSDFIAHCLNECKEQLEVHATKNTMLTVLEIEDRVEQGHSEIYKCVVNGSPVGILQVDFLRGGCAELHGLLLPSERCKGRRAVRLVNMFIKHAFGDEQSDLNLFKLKARISTGNRAMERVLKHCGFQKEGLLVGEWIGHEGRDWALVMKLVNPAKKDMIVKRPKQNE
jgi:RimJ/RimL family protein N-acetyltransferase